LGPLLILAVAAWFLHANWDSIPERFPIHWGVDGTPNGWANRTIGGVYGLIWIGLSTNILILALAYSIIFYTRQVRIAGAAAQRENLFKRLTYMFMVALLYAISTLLAVIATRPVWAHDLDEPGLVILALVVVPLVVTIVLLIYAVRTGQGGAS